MTHWLDRYVTSEKPNHGWFAITCPDCGCYFGWYSDIDEQKRLLSPPVFCPQCGTAFQTMHYDYHGYPDDL